MNLHGVVSGVIGAVNPQITATLQASTGYSIDTAGKQVASYAAPVTLSAQVQPLTADDIQHLDSLNIQGSQRAIYLNGRVDGLVRAQNKGGDLIAIAAGSPWDGVYLVTLVLELWPDWAKCAVTLQNGA